MSNEEPGIDYHWYRHLCEVFEETSMPKTIHEAIRDLRLLGVDVSKLTLQLNKLKKDWIDQDLLNQLGIELRHGFSMDHALAIHTYTLDEDDRNIAVHQKVNEVLNTHEKRTKATSPEMKATMRFLKFLDEALENLPESFSFQGNGCLYRGVKFMHDPGYFEQKFCDGKEIAWYSLQSLSSNKDVAGDFSGRKGPRTIYIVHEAEGRLKSIKHFSAIESEDEYLGRPLQKLRVRPETMKRGDESTGDAFEKADLIHLNLLPNELPRSTKDREAVLAKAHAHPRDPEGWLGLADCEAGYGRLLEERKYLIKALELDCNLVQTLLRFSQELGEVRPERTSHRGSGDFEPLAVPNSCGCH